MTLDVGTGAPVGDHTITITATDQVSYTQDATLNLRVVDIQPAAPALLSPADGAIDQPVNPDFSWELLPLVDTYNFQLSATPLSEQPLFEAYDLAQPAYTPDFALPG